MTGAFLCCGSVESICIGRGVEGGVRENDPCGEVLLLAINGKDLGEEGETETLCLCCFEGEAGGDVFGEVDDDE